MTIKEFINRLREDFLDDNKEPYYWATKTLIRYANDAEREACRRSDLIIDDTTDSVCNIDITSGTSEYSLHPKILYIVHAKNKEDDYPITQTTVQSLDNLNPYWRVEESETPHKFFINDFNRLVLYPTPKKDFTLNLTVSRLPLQDKGLTDEFEIPEQFQEGLLFWAAFLALSKLDINTNKKASAVYYENEFTRVFGKPVNVDTLLSRRRFSRTQQMKPMTKQFGMP